MKKLGIFIAGVVCGALLIILLSIAFTKCSSNRTTGVTLFEEEGECVSENSFEVFQVLDSGDALANEVDKLSIPTGLVVLFLNKEGVSYYDDQVIKVQTGKCVKQIGIYKYPTKSGFEKTVPVVDIRDK